ncbi:alpha-galactosidase [Paenibacillus lycopersici]|uniref:Alpha-galactosidase n=1 Tax=Paenibacillus lycopersici TaxID=2704462 RepID=A0A6C0G1P8_9BACL|nr:glycoside hydrolase family 36 protein [Paenibacillus lycopersici]QHT62737.1 alpha-galactosidase [Paenibacillus lycopersici]
MTNKRIRHSADGLELIVEITEAGEVKLLYFGVPEYAGQELDAKSYANRRLVEVQCTGEDTFIHHGLKHAGTMPGGRLVYRSHRTEESAGGSSLAIEQHDPVTGLTAVSHFQFYGGLPLARVRTELRNDGGRELPLEYVSTFAYGGAAGEGERLWDDKMRIHIAHNTWCGEVQWKENSLPDLGLFRAFHHSVNRLNVCSIGTWSSAEKLPIAVLENTETNTSLFWQIEHNGSWQWEVGDAEVHQLCVRLSGPTDAETQWFKRLQPGETFVSVPAAVGAVRGGLTEAANSLTAYLRTVRRRNEDNRKLPVIFNDFMHCLWGDPTTEKLKPVVDAAAEAGCEIFCIDAGWYEDSLGEWLPSTSRFEEGLGAMIGYIRSRGMVPGLWLELESVDKASPLVGKVPQEWFFSRRGRPVLDMGRYQLDFRHPDVVKHADETVDRLIRDFGIGYFKFDYNQNSGIGTDRGADSFGDGLLEHNRAYLRWVDRLFARHPELVVESCASGGMRMDYATLSRFSVQSVSDQMDYRLMGLIAAASPSVVPPEQAGIWSYPLAGSDDEAVIFNMVNVIPFRVFLGGQLPQVSGRGRELVREAIAFYKSIREELPGAVASWPLGLPTFASRYTCLLLETDNRYLLAVWRLDDERSRIDIPLSLPDAADYDKHDFSCAYPAADTDAVTDWDAVSGTLCVSLPQRDSARLIMLRKRPQQSSDAI